MPLAKGVIKDKDGQYTILTQFTITSKAEGDTFREIGQKLTFRARDYIPQGEPSKLKSAETWEKRGGGVITFQKSPKFPKVPKFEK